MTFNGQKKSSHKIWWRLGVTFAIVIGLFMASCLWWLYRTDDLDEIRANARVMGIPLTANESNTPMPSGESYTIFKKVYDLWDLIRTYNDQLKGDAYEERLYPFKLVPERAYVYHQSLESAVVTEALELIDSLPIEPHTVPQDEYLAYLNIRNWLYERVLIADSSIVTNDINRLLKVLLMYRGTSTDDFFLESSWSRIMLECVASRLKDDQSNHVHTIQLIKLLKNHYYEFLSNSAIDLFQKDFAHGKDFTTPKEYRVCSTEWTQQLHQPPSPIRDSLRGRAGRQESLSDTIRLIGLIKSNNSTMELSQYYSEIRSSDKINETWDTFNYLPDYNRQLHKRLITSYFSLLNYLNSMLAILEHQPWPTDLLDPASLPLRELKQHDNIIGVYSVGLDGVDNGGDRQLDILYPLFGSLIP